ncbi:hypothetical protein KP509_23G049200 [Ceratopteris richardii]|uniref:Uncharacterized protein n=1 Tax=Ceratopteris richardii TaxID=49495 RepID=A0A8T2S079_CERRI|nr:hypothetical protein KP509_23G049200 [Ceratopteris richardii]
MLTHVCIFSQRQAARSNMADTVGTSSQAGTSPQVVDIESLPVEEELKERPVALRALHAIPIQNPPQGHTMPVGKASHWFSDVAGPLGEGTYMWESEVEFNGRWGRYHFFTREFEKLQNNEGLKSIWKKAGLYDYFKFQLPKPDFLRCSYLISTLTPSKDKKGYSSFVLPSLTRGNELKRFRLTINLVREALDMHGMHIPTEKETMVPDNMKNRNLTKLKDMVAMTPTIAIHLRMVMQHFAFPAQDRFTMPPKKIWFSLYLADAFDLSINMPHWIIDQIHMAHQRWYKKQKSVLYGCCALTRIVYRCLAYDVPVQRALVWSRAQEFQCRLSAVGPPSKKMRGTVQMPCAQARGATLTPETTPRLPRRVQPFTIRLPRHSTDGPNLVFPPVPTDLEFPHGFTLEDLTDEEVARIIDAVNAEVEAEQAGGQQTAPDQAQPSQPDVVNVDDEEEAHEEAQGGQSEAEEQEYDQEALQVLERATAYTNALKKLYDTMNRVQEQHRLSLAAGKALMNQILEEEGVDEQYRATLEMISDALGVPEMVHTALAQSRRTEKRYGRCPPRTGKRMNVLGSGPQDTPTTTGTAHTAHDTEEAHISSAPPSPPLPPLPPSPPHSPPITNVTTTVTASVPTAITEAQTANQPTHPLNTSRVYTSTNTVTLTTATDIPIPPLTLSGSSHSQLHTPLYTFTTITAPTIPLFTITPTTAYTTDFMDISPSTAPLPSPIPPQSPIPPPPPSPFSSTASTLPFRFPFPSAFNTISPTIPLNNMYQCMSQLQQHYQHLDNQHTRLFRSHEDLQARCRDLEEQKQLLQQQHVTLQEQYAQLVANPPQADDEERRHMDELLHSQIMDNLKLRRNLGLLRKHMSTALEENKRLQKQNEENLEAAMEGSPQEIDPERFKAIPSENMKVVLETHADLMEAHAALEKERDDLLRQLATRQTSPSKSTTAEDTSEEITKLRAELEELRSKVMEYERQPSPLVEPEPDDLVPIEVEETFEDPYVPMPTPGGKRTEQGMDTIEIEAPEWMQKLEKVATTHDDRVAVQIALMSKLEEVVIKSDYFQNLSHHRWIGPSDDLYVPFCVLMADYNAEIKHHTSREPTSATQFAPDDIPESAKQGHIRQPMWRIRLLETYPEMVRTWNNMPLYIKYNPCYCPVFRRRSWPEYTQTVLTIKGCEKWLNYVYFAPPKGPPTIGYMISTIRYWGVRFKNVPDVMTQMCLKIFELMLVTFRTFKNVKEPHLSALGFNEGNQDLVYDMSTTPSINVVYAWHARIKYLPACFKQTFEEMFVTGFWEYHSEIFIPRPSHLLQLFAVEQALHSEKLRIPHPEVPGPVDWDALLTDLAKGLRIAEHHLAQDVVEYYIQKPTQQGSVRDDRRERGGGVSSGQGTEGLTRHGSQRRESEGREGTGRHGSQRRSGK